MNFTLAASLSIESLPKENRDPHPLFMLPEILRVILSFAPEESCASAARVSSIWRDIALDWLWRDLPNVFPLLRLFDDLKWTEQGWVGLETFALMVVH